MSTRSSIFKPYVFLSSYTCVLQFKKELSLYSVIRYVIVGNHAQCFLPFYSHITKYGAGAQHFNSIQYKLSIYFIAYVHRPKTHTIQYRCINIMSVCIIYQPMIRNWFYLENQLSIPILHWLSCKHRLKNTKNTFLLKSLNR